MLIVCLELVFRVTGLADSPINSPVLPGEALGLNRHDHELFWSLRPNVRISYQGVIVATNELGLRSGPVRPKRKGEFRILSLGESTTFGAGVEIGATYSVRLEQILNEISGWNRFSVINAGVSAYSSFQSLVYLKQRGFELNPDLVIFYHEYNDYLPTYVRDSQNNVLGMNQSDPERYRTRQRKFHRGLMRVSAGYRYLCYRVALSKIRDFQKDHSEDRSQTVVTRVGGREESLEMPSRVRPEERVAVLLDLINQCRRRGVRLVVIHPSYRLTVPHGCELTEVCAANDVPMFEAHPVLHPADATRDELFQDPVHPTALGHERLAQALAGFLFDGKLLSPEGTK